MKTNYETIKVGQVYKPAVGLEEGVRFSLSSSGAFLMYGFNNPTEYECSQMKSGNHFEIRYVEMAGIVWVTSKCGDLAWTDAPYNPRLSSGLPGVDYEEGEGLPLTLVMVDVPSGIVKSVRVIGLGTRFSRDLSQSMLRLLEEPMTIAEANLAINFTMQRCSSEYLAKIAPSSARYAI